MNTSARMRAGPIARGAGITALLALQLLLVASQTDWPLQVTLLVSRKNDAAVGTMLIKNPTNKPVTVGKLVLDFRFMDKDMDVHKDDIRQQLALKKCGDKALPLQLPAGAKLECPIASRANTYGGKISAVAAVVPTSAPDYPSGDYTGFAVVREVFPAAVFTSKTYKEVKGTAIPGKDLSCEQKDPNNPNLVSSFCKICGGRAAVEAACNKRYQECVAYDMESSGCGYLKASQGPREGKKGFSTWLRG